MILQIKTERDQLSILQLVEPECNTWSWPKHLAMYAELHAPPQEDIAFHIAPSLLPPTYRANASMLALKVKSHSLHFQSASGHLPKEGHVTIILYRAGKPSASDGRRPYANSLFARISSAMKQGLIMTIPHEEIPQGYIRRPEQLVYKIKIQTDMHIKIKQNKTSWTISVR